MRYLTFLILLAFLSFYSCKQEGGIAGYTTSDSGLVYKHHIKNGTTKPNPGDKVYYHVDFRKNDSLVTSSREKIDPIELTVPLEDDGNFLREMLLMMSVGDSMTMVRHKDSVRQNLPTTYEAGDLVYVDISLKGLKDKELVLKEKAFMLSSFTPSKLGRLMKKEVDTKGKLPNPGDGVVYTLKLKKGETEVYSSIALGREFRMQIAPENLEVEKLKNPILEALASMAQGDSMQMAIEYDSMKTQVRPEWGFQSGDVGVFEIRLDKIVPKSEVEKEIRESRKKQEAEAGAREKEMKAKRAPFAARYESVKKEVAKKAADYKAGNLKVETSKSGLKYIIVDPGSGLQAGNESGVSVQYAGHLTSGEEFDSSFRVGDPIQFAVGKGQVIKGWDEGLKLLKPGGKAYLFIPPSLGYGEAGSPPKIPGNSELIFYVELLEVKS